MSKVIGFIGCGKMAQAIIGGILSADGADHKQILFSAKSHKTKEHVQETYRIMEKENKEVAAQSDILFLAIKPDLHGSIIEEVKDVIRPETIIVTMAAGITLPYVQEAFGFNVKAIRTMPNTPSMVGEGMTAMTRNEYVNDDEAEEVKKLLSSFGKVEEIEENLMDTVPAISGSSPAYVYMFIEALADGGVRGGLSRDQSYKMAAQAVLGAAKMVLETGMHPGQLKDQVCTPGGATIEAVAELEQNQFKGAVLSAMEACMNKTKGMSE
ncbi:pyrroline-5-carboxylate reductase [Cytobacillus gottheilii]|uniref:pyrroline-5-carboxylate reductase n=1 Tax=Cytobacillus gottheilii TaxID=859144 RepID=UPI0008334945|nr:pyrroline-5-carboxylate reductase [Cytobacillus gottheilii]